MEISGKIIQCLPEQSGTSRAGNPWKKRVYILETQETYPKKVAFDLFGDRVDQYPMKEGDMVKVSFDINSREFNGRWYTDISAWKVEPANQGAPAGTAAPVDPGMPGGYPEPPKAFTPGGDDEELPF